MRFVQGLALVGVAMVVGLVLGGWQPRQEARRWKALAEAAPTECTDRAEVARQLAGVFRGRPLDAGLPDEAGAAGADEPGAARPAGAEVVEGPDAEARPDPDPEPADPEEAVRLAREAVRLRRAQARAALVEAGATDEQLAAIDAATERMNTELSALADEFVAGLDEGRPPDRREMMLFATDALDVLVTADDTLFSTFDEELRAELDPTALDPFSYVDESVVESIVRLRER